ncbi:MAG: hypothetical protein HOW73_46045 [Polyangiaceae bacterium]|nr:hypothetical protein [Polyangiaceae bacterium]
MQNQRRSTQARGHLSRPGAALAFLIACVPAAIFLSAGCSSGYSLCDRSCDCTGCSDSVLEACYDTVDDQEREAENQDCLPEYDEVVACLNENFYCDNETVKYDSGCLGEYAELAECALR